MFQGRRFAYNGLRPALVRDGLLSGENRASSVVNVARANETFEETPASLETYACGFLRWRERSRQCLCAGLIARAITQKKLTGIDTMSTEGTPETFPNANGLGQQH